MKITGAIVLVVAIFISILLLIVILKYVHYLWDSKKDLEEGIKVVNGMSWMAVWASISWGLFYFITLNY
jgi:hypothetical protein